MRNSSALDATAIVNVMVMPDLKAMMETTDMVGCSHRDSVIQFNIHDQYKIYLHI